MGLKFSDIEWAFEVTSFNNGTSDVSVVVHIPEGRLYAQDDHGVMDFDDDLQIPDDVCDSEDWVWVPTKRDLNLGTPLVFQFIEMEMPDEYDYSRFGLMGAVVHLNDIINRILEIPDYKK